MTDPKHSGFDRTTNQTHAPRNADIPDAAVATIELAVLGSGASCGLLTPVFNPNFGVDVCVSFDADGDPSVNILSFCTILMDVFQTRYSDPLCLCPASAC